MELWILNYIKIYNMFMLSYNTTSTGLVFISLKTMHSMIFIEKIIMNISMLETVLQPYRNQCLLFSNNALEDQDFRARQGAYCSGFMLKGYCNWAP